METSLKKVLEDQEPPDNIVLFKRNIADPLINGVCVGKVVSVQSGQIMVDFPDYNTSSLKARSVVNISSEDENRQVLLAFENNDFRLPIIIGMIQEHPAITEEVGLDKDKKKDVFIDNERVVFEAEKEIELRCGMSSILLKKDGKVIIKGTKIVSRSSGVNKIKGASVQIN